MSEDAVGSFIRSSFHRVSRLESVDLTDNGIQSVCAYLLLGLWCENMPHIRELILDKNQLLDRSAKILAESLEHDPTLEILSMEGCTMGDDGAAHFLGLLSNHPSLWNVRIGHNHFNDTMCANFANCLMRNRRIAAFQVFWNRPLHSMSKWIDLDLVF